MHIDSIEIGNYKNLVDFMVDFNSSSNLSILIGRNGSGKSNFLEAISIIFANLFEICEILDRNIENEVKVAEVGNVVRVPFAYKLQFSNKSKQINIEYSVDDVESGLVMQEDRINTYIILIDNNEASFIDLIPLIPMSIFGYYSGETSRLSKYFRGSQNIYRKLLVENNGDIEFPRLFFINERVLEYIMFVCKVYEGTDDIHSEFITNYVKDISSFSFTFKSPRTDVDMYHNLENQQYDFLEMLTKAGEYRLGKKGQISSVWFDSKEHFENLAAILRDQFVSQRVLFENLINLHFTGVVREAKLTIYSEWNHDIKNLSEGEKQLLTILGLLYIQKENNSIYLFDEPDAFLYPKWQRKLASLIQEIAIDGQLVFTTHSPITLGEVHKDSVLIFHEGEVLESPINTYGNRNDFILEILMGVPSRSEKFEPVIKAFNEAITRKDIERSVELVSKIQEMDLPSDDIFYSKADAAIRRLKILHEKNS